MRGSRNGGGVALFIKDHLEYTLRNDLSINNGQIESKFVEIDREILGKNRNVIAGVIYRPPDTDMKLFNEHVVTILSSIKSENKLPYLMGDWNINLLNIEQHAPSQDFFDIMMSYSLLPTITKPTRVTHRTATLIDNIFCGSLLDSEKIFNGILYTDISDHFPIFHIDYSTEQKNEPLFIQRRIHSDRNISKFRDALEIQDWSTVLEASDPQISYSNFHNIYSKLYETAFPLKNIKIGYKTRKPWLTDELKNGIKYKNKLYFRQKKANNPEITSLYKTYKNRLNFKLIEAEKNAL